MDPHTPNVPSYCQRIAEVPSQLAATGSGRFTLLLIVAFGMILVGFLLRRHVSRSAWATMSVALLALVWVSSASVERASAQTPECPDGYTFVLDLWLEATATTSTSTSTTSISTSTSTTSTSTTSTTLAPVLTDFASSISATPSTLVVGGTTDLAITLQEVLGGEATGPVTVRVSRPTVLTHPASNVAPPFAGTGWAFVSSNSGFYTFTYTFPGSAAHAVAPDLVITLPTNPSAPALTVQPVTASIADGSGGDSNTANNVSNTNLTKP
jgi:hypothetical protein